MTSMKQKIHTLLTSLPIWARAVVGIALLPLFIAAMPIVLLAIIGDEIVGIIEGLIA